MTTVDRIPATSTTGARTLTDVAEAIRTGATTSVQVVTDAIEVAERYDKAVGVYLARYDEQALEAARAADAALAAGEPVGPLHGVPLGIKDIITTREGETTAQSLVHDRTAMSGDAVVVERLRAAGGIVMGKLTTMEFAIGMPDPAKPFPIPRCSWDLERWAGGSSSGSGSSVSLGAVLGALGTDTGGSIRIPAAYCGITGLMPTYGLVPKSGTVPLGYTLDHIGPMARSARDCAALLDVLAGPHPSDPTLATPPGADRTGSVTGSVTGSFTDALTGDLTGVRIGVDRLERVNPEYDPALNRAFDAALDVLAGLGAQVVEIELPHYAEMTTADEVIMFTEAFSHHLPDLRTRWLDYGAATRRTIGTGVYYSAADYLQAQRARRVGQKAIRRTFEDVDLVLTPTAGGGAASLERVKDGFFQPGGIGPVYTGYWDTTGNPVMSVPFGFTDDGMPLGLQIAGRWFDERLVLRAGDAFQGRTDWHLHTPDPLDDVPAP
ncbi:MULTISPECIES: amidase [unclassified Streptomyces]|uniref:amidase n=1 Tax=unclassified Streptomyces TaxID=2593676 RepID=UPI00278BFB45|nr:MULTISPECIES: amidase [unclassified Streptomyces]